MRSTKSSKASKLALGPLKTSFNIFYIKFQSSPRVKFAFDTNHQTNTPNQNVIPLKVSSGNSLQRSKSLSSADALARGIAGLGLGVGENTDIGTFKPEIQVIVDQALKDPNQLNARALMELANQIMQRAVEGRRLVFFHLLESNQFLWNILMAI